MKFIFTADQLRKLGYLSILPAIMGGVMFFLLFRQSPPQGTEEQRRIAAACVQVLKSGTGVDGSLEPNDPKWPEAIRALHPQSIDVVPDTSVVIMRDGNPPEYHLTKKNEGYVLYGAGGSFGGEHKELVVIPR